MAILLSMRLPPGAADLTLRQLDLLLCLRRLEERSQTTTYAYWKFMGLTVAQARATLAKIEAAGLAVSRVLKQGRSITGKRWALTEEGRATVTAYETRGHKEDGNKVNEPSSESAPSAASSNDMGVRPNLYDAMSEKGKEALRAAIPEAIRRRVVADLEEGAIPDPETLMAWGVRELVARDLAASAARIAARLSNASQAIGPTVETRETRVAAATEADVERARSAGITVPHIKAGQGDNAEALAEAAQLLVREAAARRPDLLKRGILVARLPQLVWAMLQGAVAEYGALVKRARALLRWLAEDRFEIPKGYDARAGEAIRSRLRISDAIAPPSVETAQLLQAGMYYTYGLQAAAPTAQSVQA